LSRMIGQRAWFCPCALSMILGDVPICTALRPSTTPYFVHFCPVPERAESRSTRWTVESHCPLSWTLPERVLQPLQSTTIPTLCLEPCHLCISLLSAGGHRPDACCLRPEGVEGDVDDARSPVGPDGASFREQSPFCRERSRGQASVDFTLRARHAGRPNLFFEPEVNIRGSSAH